MNLLTSLDKIKENDSNIINELLIDNKIDFEDLYQRTLAKAEKGIRVMKVYILKNSITQNDLGRNYLSRAKNKQKLFKEIFYDKEIVESFYLVFERINLESQQLKEIVTGIAIPRLEYEGLYNDSTTGSKYSLIIDYDNDLTRSNIITKALIEFNSKHYRDPKLLDAYAEDESITHEELCNYIHTLTQKDNYFYLVNFLFQKLKSCGYPKGYTIPPYVPKDLVWYYKKINEEQNDIDDSEKIRVKIDKYFSPIRLILEIEENLKKVNELNRKEHIEKLEQIKEKINNTEKEQHLSIDTTKELCALSVEVEAQKKKELISIETIENFFYHFLKNISNDLWDKEILEKKRLLYTFINYFEQSKSQIAFDKYYEIQNLIFQTLTSIIIYQPKMRNMILKDLTVTYCKGVRICMQGIVEYLLELDGIKGTSDYYQFLSLIIGEVSDLEILQYSTLLIDKLNKEEVKSLEVFQQNYVKKKNKNNITRKDLVKMEIILATNNKNKLKEIREILVEYKIYSLKDFNVSVDVLEDGKTFYENALKKATEIYEITKMPVIADDSGLCIDKFNGWPGVMTSRFLGDNRTDLERNNAILEKMANLTGNDRTAKVVCDLVFYDGISIVNGVGTLKGSIPYERKGSNGFGFDEIFELPNGKTLAELTALEKNVVSARALAAHDLKKKILSK